MAKIYLPTDLVDSPCKMIQNDYFRVFTDNNRTTYYDVYFKNGYILKKGSTGSSTNISQCDTVNTWTDNIFYRYDCANSLIIFFIISIVCFYFPFRIFSRAFGRWLRI